MSTAYKVIALRGIALGSLRTLRETIKFVLYIHIYYELVPTYQLSGTTKQNTAPANDILLVHKAALK